MACRRVKCLADKTRAKAVTEIAARPGAAVGKRGSMKTIEVVAAIIQRDGAILATQRGYGNYAGFWEFPGGKMEPGETREQAIVREIREEMDADIAVDSFVTTVDTDYPEYHVTMHCFLAHLLSDFKLLEHSDAKWVTSENIDSLDWLPTDIQVIEALKAQGLPKAG